EQCATRASKGILGAKVTGSVTIFSQVDKLPYGFFAKRIEQAKLEHTRDIFFFDVDTDVASSPARIQNIAERRCTFVYLYRAPYNPAKGQMEGLDLEQVF